VAPPTPPIGVGAHVAALALAPAMTRCTRCATDNQPGVRYCVTCGNVLGGQPVPAPVEPPHQRPVAPPIDVRPHAPVAPIQPAAVVHVRPASQAPPPAAPVPVPASPDGSRACPRCRGVTDAGAQFCRFCGASLGSPSPAARPQLAEAPAPIVDPAPPPQARSAAALPAPAPVARTAALAPVSYGRIVVITKDGQEGASYPLGEQVDIGRAEGDVVLRDDRYLSPRHARIVRKGGTSELTLSDLASTNGVYLRLPRDTAKEVPLADQDLFLVGQQVLKFELVRDAEEGLAPATQHGTLVFGTPLAPRLARLSQRTVEGVTRDVFHIQKAETVLGRESGDIVFTDDPFLSRRHAVIKYSAQGRQFSLSDLGSSNGTFVQIRGEVPLKSGDQFRVGQQLFRVDLTAAPAP
jgi:pSer/pThr/pTyr-binding forkhead associated (FHA) protein